MSTLNTFVPRISGNEREYSEILRRDRGKYGRLKYVSDITTMTSFDSSEESSTTSTEDSITCKLTSASQSPFDGSVETTTTSSEDSTTSVGEVWSSSSSESSNSEFSSSDECVRSGSGHRQMAVSRLARDLYSGARITVLQSILLLVQFTLIHTLTKRAFEDLLRLVSQHLPEAASSSVPRSVYSLKKLFVNTFPHVTGVKIAYCSSCHALLRENRACEKETCVLEANVHHFIYVSVAQQLKAKLEDASESELYINVSLTVWCCVHVCIIHGRDLVGYTAPAANDANGLALMSGVARSRIQSVGK